jgi:hypothetical protein
VAKLDRLPAAGWLGQEPARQGQSGVRSASATSARLFPLPVRAEGTNLTTMNAAPKDRKLVELLGELHQQKEWSPERYRKIGVQLQHSLDSADSGCSPQPLLKLAKAARLTTVVDDSIRASTYVYLCLQLASDKIPDEDFSIYRKHRLSWDQIRWILRALGRGCPTEKRAAVRTRIRARLKEHGVDGFTPFIRGLFPAKSKPQ